VEQREPLAALAPPGAVHPLSGPPGARADADPTPLDAWAPRAARLGAYLHLPFCVSRCGYCSFNTAPYAPAAMGRFLPALGREIALAGRAPWAAARRLDTVFLGGGTPSLATPDEIAALLDGLRAAFGLEDGAEVTIECNPESATAERLRGYREAGVTRASFGVQSLDDAILRTLDRAHSADGARRAFEAARAAGLDDVSVDLIYGLPGLDSATWERTVRGVLAWGPEHLSAYGLTLDEGSLWRARGVTGLPDEDAVAAQYWRLAEVAAAAGLEHYEISNYGRPGHQARHNLRYWRRQEYLGLGPGAAGFLGEVRYINVKPVDRYAALLERGHTPLDSHERLTPRQELGERLILGLRLAEGIPAAWLDERVRSEAGRLPELLASWRDGGLLVQRGDRVRLTEAGFLVSDALFAELV
jgi:oxygen-independent coproporphyrinogen-3 oxidase